MSETEQAAIENVSKSAAKLTLAGFEGTVLAITASYLAGKEAGMRETQTAEPPGQ